MVSIIQHQIRFSQPNRIFFFNYIMYISLAMLIVLSMDPPHAKIRWPQIINWEFPKWKYLQLFHLIYCLYVNLFGPIIDLPAAPGKWDTSASTTMNRAQAIITRDVASRVFICWFIFAPLGYKYIPELINLSACRFIYSRDDATFALGGGHEIDADRFNSHHDLYEKKRSSNRQWKRA